VEGALESADKNAAKGRGYWPNGTMAIIAYIYILIYAIITKTVNMIVRYSVSPILNPPAKALLGSIKYDSKTTAKAAKTRPILV
jgi:hypothetical protein